MAKVHIYPSCNDTVAHLAGLKANTRMRTQAAARNAEMKLNARRAEGHSYISWEVRDVDGYVSLNDPKGGAMSIEFGRTGKMGKGGPTQGVFALQGIW